MRRWANLCPKIMGAYFGLYDELSNIPDSIYGKGLTVSHELALFLQLYNGNAWSRQTDIINHTYDTVVCVCVCMRVHTNVSA